jgi:hypothetical protein
MRNRVVFSVVPGIATILLAAVCSAPLPAQDSGAESDSAASARRPLITQAVDETQLTKLRGNTHPLARPQFDLGTAPASLPMERMLLVLKRSSEQETALRKLLDDQQDKKSPNYHKWLAPDRFGKQFGPTDADIQTITLWLQSHGFQVSPTKGRTVMEFSGSASQVHEAFHTSIHKYIVNGEQHWANVNDPSIPAALAPAVAGMYTLHNFVKKPHYRLAKEKIEAKWKVGKPPQFTASNGLHALAPADYATIYNINPVYNAAIDGSGIAIGIVGRSDINLTDIQNFRQVFAIGGPTPQVIVNGPDPGDVPGDDFEATLDVSWSGAIAPGAQVYFVNSAVTNTTDGVVLSELYILENDLSNIMSYSFGGCEADFGAEAAADLGLAEQAAAQGISFMASTGDAGAEGCDNPNSETVASGPISINLPASTPFTTAVGGTIFNENGSDATYWSSTNDPNTLGSALKYIPEDVWNESCASGSCPANGSPNIAAGGGGASTGDVSQGGTFSGFPKPSYQAPASIIGMPNDNARDIPDVALTAAAGNDPYLLCFQASCVPNAQNQISFAAVGGTSASTPSFAGIMALVDEKMSLLPPVNPNNNSSRQGLANYVLYPLAAAQQAAKTACNASSTSTTINSACVFNDITVGNNAVPGEIKFGTPSALYQATTGYDQGTGLGSVNVANLVNAWASATYTPTTTTLTLTPTSPATLNNIPHGSVVTVNATVAETSSPSTPAIGDVSVIAATGPSGSITNLTGVDGFTLVNGTTPSSTTSSLPGGTYTVTAHYAGSTSASTFFAPSDSNQVQVTVTAESSSTTISGFDPNNNPIATGNNSFLFGTPLVVRVDVAGASGQGIPTGQVTFADTFAGGLPGQVAGFGPVTNPVSLNSLGNAILGGGSINLVGILNYDAGNHTISASYPGDPSFNKSATTASVTFSITPAFLPVSGLANVTIASPGSSGTTTLGVIASTGFANTVSITCSGLPAEAACNMPPITTKGPTSIVTGTITVTTMGPHLVMLQPQQRTYYFAAIFAGGLPLAGIFVLATPRRRRWNAVLGLIVLGLLMMVPACGGGNHTTVQHQQDPGTPAGTYTVTVSASGGNISGQVGSFTLTVQ